MTHDLRLLGLVNCMTVAKVSKVDLIAKDNAAACVSGVSAAAIASVVKVTDLVR